MTKRYILFMVLVIGIVIAGYHIDVQAEIIEIGTVTYYEQLWAWDAKQMVTVPIIPYYPNGLGVRYSNTTNEFIGFLGRGQ